MSIFGDESGRLLREQWPDANMLAQELYAIFNSDQPIKITSPVEMSGNSPVAPLTITNNFDGGNGAGLVVHGNTLTTGGMTLGGGVFDFTPAGQGNVTYGGYTYNQAPATYTFENNTWNSNPQKQDGKPVLPPAPVQPKLTQPQAAAGGGNAFAGTVLSGSGKNYQVQIVGTAPPGGTSVSVNFPMVADEEKIPAGTWVTAVIPVQTGSDDQGNPIVHYYGSVPVWLG